MREVDLQPFTELLDAVCSLLSRGTYTPNAVNTALWFRSLSAYPLEAVRAGLDAHVRDPQRGRFVPTPADVIAQIEGSAAADGRPGAEEAWAIALRSRDETDTVVWTQEIAQALGIAKPILEVGDDVGARMAFKEAYTRLVEEARHQRTAAEWIVSLGYDPKRRDVAIRAAVGAGRLPLTALPAPEDNAVPLLALANAPGIPPHVAEELRRLTEKFRATQDAPPSVDAKARAETDARRAEARRQVEDYAKQHGIDLTLTPNVEKVERATAQESVDAH